MAKFFGKVGYAISKEVTPGVWKDSITELPYYGDILKKATRWRNGSGLNDDLEVSTRVSIIADEYMLKHFSKIKYIQWMGDLWKVTDIEVNRPRLILTLGGEWNGSTPGSSSGTCGLSGCK